MKLSNSFLGFLFLLLSFQTSFGQASINKDAPVSEMYQFTIDLNQDYRSLYRFYQIDNSPERRERFKTFFTERKSALSKFSFTSLSTGGKVDYLMVQRMIDNQLHRLASEEQEYTQMKSWVEMCEPIYEIEKLRRRGKHLESQKVAQTLNEIEKKIKVASIKLDEEQPAFPKDLSKRSSGILNGHIEALESVYDFYIGYDPDFSWWVDKPTKSLIKQIESYEKQISELVDYSALPPDDGSGIIGNPIGRTELIRQLEYEMIPYSPEELVEIANKEFVWCDKELLKASQEMGFGNDWKAAQEKVKMSFVPEGQQPEAMLELYDQSIDFLKQHDLLTIPPIAEETWRMSMISPERQRISPFFLGGEVLQISYPTNEMEHDEKLMSMRGNNPHFSRSTVHHELIAGHHLQGFVNRRNHEYRNFRTPFWTEGWALYWELLLWDMDFPRSPEDRIGMLFWRMHRCARIIFSLNYHLGNWTPQQCIDYLVDRVGHERANAEGEVRRSFTGNYGPLYQIAYMVGGMQFYALKKELVDSDKMTYKEFHDAVLNENSMPVEMVRAILTNQNLKGISEAIGNFTTNRSMGQLQDRVIIITGATSGMGKAMALAFAKEGASLILSGRNNTRAIELMTELAGYSKNSVFIDGDVSLYSVNEKLVEQAVSSYGKLDTIVANAGVLGLGAVGDLSIESWHQTLNTNLNALFYLSKLAIPQMLKNGNGNILANASIAAFKSFPNHPAYCVSKAGQVALIKQLAAEYGPTIRANAMCPGPIDTPLIWESAKAFPNPENAVEKAGHQTFLNRLGTSEEVAKLALFLISDASSFITGSTINIDGGIMAS